jgi:mono/diheme cytochrome c family protein
MTSIITTPRLLLTAALLLSMPALADGPGDPARGKAVFQQNCMICHGAKGHGDGPAAGGLATRPANYSERTSSEERQLKIITNGGASEKLSPIMPAWGDTLSEQEIRDVLSYVRTVLAVKDPVAPAPSVAAAPVAAT